MAKAITSIEYQRLNQVDEQNLAVAEIIKAASESREALVATLNILQNLNNIGVLALMQGLLNARTEVGALAIQLLNQPNFTRALKNGMNAIQFFGSIEPAKLQTIFHGISNGLHRAVDSLQDRKPSSFWELSKGIRDPEVKFSLHTILEFIHGVGEVFEREYSKVH